MGKIFSHLISENAYVQDIQNYTYGAQWQKIKSIKKWVEEQTDTSSKEKYVELMANGCIKSAYRC